MVSTTAKNNSDLTAQGAAFREKARIAGLPDSSVPELATLSPPIELLETRVWREYVHSLRADSREEQAISDQNPRLARLAVLLKFKAELDQALESGTILPAGFSLRRTQYEALLQLSRFCNDPRLGQEFSDGIHRTGVFASTGIGKTAFYIMIANIAARAGLKTLVFLPYKDLMYQAENDLRKFAPDLPYGVYYSDRKTYTAQPLALALYQSSRRFLIEVPTPFDILIKDEAHLALSTLRLDLPAQVPRLSLALALTGSPSYNDSRQVQRHFGPPLLHIDTAEAIRQGQTAPAYSMTLRTNLKFEGLELNGSGQLTATSSDIVARNEIRNRAIIQVLKSPQLRDKGIFVTCLNTTHADLLAKLAEDAGLGPVATLHYHTTGDSKEILERCLRGEIKILFLVNKTTGIDIPNFSVLVNGRPIFSLPGAIQRFGRPGRLDPNNPNKVMLCIDVVDNYDLTERPITGDQILKGSYILPESTDRREEFERQIQEFSQFLVEDLPEGLEIELETLAVAELGTADKSSAVQAASLATYTTKQVAEILNKAGLDTPERLCTIGMLALLSQRLDINEPEFRGTVGKLLDNAEVALARTDVSIRRVRARIVLDDIHGDALWEEIAKRANIDIRAEEALRKLATLPIKDVVIVCNSSRDTNTPIERVYGDELLRLYGISREKTATLDTDAPVTEEILKEIISKQTAELKRMQDSLLEMRGQAAAIADVVRTDSLEDVLATTPLKYLSNEKFIGHRFVDPESGQAFTGGAVCLFMGIKSPYDLLLESVDDPEFQEMLHLANSASSPSEKSIHAMLVYSHRHGALIDRLRRSGLADESNPDNYDCYRIHIDGNQSLSLRALVCVIEGDLLASEQIHNFWTPVRLEHVERLKEALHANDSVKIEEMLRLRAKRQDLLAISHDYNRILTRNDAIDMICKFKINGMVPSDDINNINRAILTLAVLGRQDPECVKGKNQERLTEKARELAISTIKSGSVASDRRGFYDLALRILGLTEAGRTSQVAAIQRDGVSYLCRKFSDEPGVYFISIGDASKPEGVPGLEVRVIDQTPIIRVISVQYDSEEGICPPQVLLSLIGFSDTKSFVILAEMRLTSQVLLRASCEEHARANPKSIAILLDSDPRRNNYNHEARELVHVPEGVSLPQQIISILDTRNTTRPLLKQLNDLIETLRPVRETNSLAELAIVTLNAVDLSNPQSGNLINNLCPNYSKMTAAQRLMALATLPNTLDKDRLLAQALDLLKDNQARVAELDEPQVMAICNAVRMNYTARQNLKTHLDSLELLIRPRHQADMDEEATLDLQPTTATNLERNPPYFSPKRNLLLFKADGSTVLHYGPNCNRLAQEGKPISAVEVTVHDAASIFNGNSACRQCSCPTPKHIHNITAMYTKDLRSIAKRIVAVGPYSKPQREG